MNIGRTLSITKRIFRGLMNDRRALAMMFVTPIASIIIFGVAFSGDINSVEVVVVDLDEGYQIPPSTVPVSVSDAIVANLDTDVLIVRRAATEAEALETVQNGDAYGMIVLPEDLTRNAYSRLMDPGVTVEAKVRVELDQSNVTVANSILKEVNEATLKASSSMGVEAAVTLDNSHAIYAEDAVLRDFTVPGITVFDVFVLTFILTILAFVSERTSGNLARLRVTPLEDGELVLGYGLAFSIIAVLQAGAMLAIIVVVFKVMVAGSILLAFLVVALLGVLSLSLGMLLSTLAKRDAQAIQFVALVIMPSLLLGGCFWPLESLPAWVRPLSYAIPPRYAADAMRAVMLRGWGIGQIWVELAAMAAITVGCLVLSVFRLRGDRGR